MLKLQRPVPAEVLRVLAQRSALIGRTVRAYWKSRARRRRDLEAIDREADRTNRESDELLDLQA